MLPCRRTVDLIYCGRLISQLLFLSLSLSLSAPCDLRCAHSFVLFQVAMSCRTAAGIKESDGAMWHAGVSRRGAVQGQQGSVKRASRSGAKRGGLPATGQGCASSA